MAEEFNQAEELEQVIQCAASQAAYDIPYVEVGEVRPYEYHATSGRWYVEVDLYHPEHGDAVALYRVYRSPLGFAAFKVDIREAE